MDGQPTDLYALVGPSSDLHLAITSSPASANAIDGPLDPIHPPISVTPESRTTTPASKREWITTCSPSHAQDQSIVIKLSFMFMIKRMCLFWSPKESLVTHDFDPSLFDAFQDGGDVGLIRNERGL